MTHAVTVHHLAHSEIVSRLNGLSDVLLDCVEGGASVSFMAPMSRTKADTFWQNVRDRVAAGGAELFVAEIDGRVVGTVQLGTALPENQPHRADVAKMLVHRSARNQGIGRALLQAAEDTARTLGKTLLVLDTASNEAERLYRRAGWKEAGRIPGYALFPDGRLCDTIFFYKRL